MSNKRTKSKRKANPLMRAVPRVARPKLSFDGQVLNSTLYLGSANTGVGSVGKDVIHVDCETGLGLTRAVGPMVILYNEYKFRSVTVEWIPSISPASVDAGSRVHIAYVDNPEKIVNFDALAAAGAVQAVRSVKNCKTFNAWERYSYTVPLTYRRKLFDVDGTPAANTADVLDRICQGEIQVAIESITPSVVLGTYRITFNLELHGLAFTQTT